VSKSWFKNENHLLFIVKIFRSTKSIYDSIILSPYKKSWKLLAFIDSYAPTHQN